MEETVKLKWYFRLFAKLDDSEAEIDLTNRAFAYIIDWVAASLVTAFPTVVLYMMVTKTQTINQNLFLFASPYGYLAGFLSLLFCLVYYVWYPYRHHGQTPGKKFMDMRIVRKDGSDCDLLTLCKRQIIGCLLLQGCLFASGNYVFQELSLVCGYDLTLILRILTAAIALISIFIAMRKKSRRMLQDYLADTKLIHVEKETA